MQALKHPDDVAGMTFAAAVVPALEMLLRLLFALVNHAPDITQVLVNARTYTLARAHTHTQTRARTHQYTRTTQLHARTHDSSALQTRRRAACNTTARSMGTGRCISTSFSSRRRCSLSLSLSLSLSHTHTHTHTHTHRSPHAAGCSERVA